MDFSCKLIILVSNLAQLDFMEIKLLKNVSLVPPQIIAKNVQDLYLLTVPNVMEPQDFLPSQENA